MCTLHMVLLFWITNPHAPLLPNSHKPFPVYSSRTAWPSSQSNTCSFLPLSKGHSRSFKYCYYTNMLTTRKWQHTRTALTVPNGFKVNMMSNRFYFYFTVRAFVLQTIFTLVKCTKLLPFNYMYNGMALTSNYIVIFTFDPQGFVLMSIENEMQNKVW